MNPVWLFMGSIILSVLLIIAVSPTHAKPNSTQVCEGNK